MKIFKKFQSDIDKYIYFVGTKPARPPPLLVDFATSYSTHTELKLFALFPSSSGQLPIPPSLQSSNPQTGGGFIPPLHLPWPAPSRSFVRVGVLVPPCFCCKSLLILNTSGSRRPWKSPKSQMLAIRTV